MIPPRTKPSGLEVITSPINTPKNSSINNMSSPLAEIAVSPGRVKRLAGNLTPNHANPSRFFRRDENRHSGHVNQSMTANNGAGAGVGSNELKASSPRVGIQHAAAAVVSQGMNLFRKTESTNTTNNTANDKPTTYQEIPSLMTESETFDDDLSKSSLNNNYMSAVSETELYKKFNEAFEMTLRQHPGILPGAPSVVSSIQNALYKLTKERADKEEELRKQISVVRKEKVIMERRLQEEMGSLTLTKVSLQKELDKLTLERDRTDDSLRKQLDAVRAMKEVISSKLQVTNAEKEELTKHLGHLSKSREELEKALEKEMNTVESQRDALQSVIAQRKALQKQKAENKEMESKIELMTEAATKDKLALQVENEELKQFEVHLEELRKSNEVTKKELEEEKARLLEVSRTLETKKLAVIESRHDIERNMQKEIEELQAQMEESKREHAKEMERLVRGKVSKYLRGEEVSTLAYSEEDEDLETIIQSRIETELKQKDIEMKERELELREREMKEREEREREVRDAQQKEREKELQERMKKELEVREKELEEKILREREEWERKERERKEKELEEREKELKAKMAKEREEAEKLEKLERERLEREIRMEKERIEMELQKEREMIEREAREREMRLELEAQEREAKEKEAKERVEREAKEKEAREREAKEKDLREKETKLEAMRKKRRARKQYEPDDDDTLGDDSTIETEYLRRRSRSRGSRSTSRRSKWDDDESTVESADVRRKRYGKRQEGARSKEEKGNLKPSKEDELRKELDELRKEIAKNKNESTDEIDEMLKHRRQTTGIVTSVRKYLSPQDDLRGEIASLREEIKMNHRESQALRGASGPHSQESRGYHEPSGYSSAPREYRSVPARERSSSAAPQRDFDDERGYRAAPQSAEKRYERGHLSSQSHDLGESRGYYSHHDTPGGMSYASAPAKVSAERGYERGHYEPDRSNFEPERRAAFRRRYDDDGGLRRAGYGDDSIEYERGSRFSSSRFSSGLLNRQPKYYL